jgi:glutamate---cysteine ligase / carboxylate-amine ligase
MSKAPEKAPLHLFEGVGVELEYMIVGQQDLQVKPISDLLIQDKTGQIQSDVELGPMAWSNELVLHVIELKTNHPAKSLEGLAELFQAQVQDINGLLQRHGARLLPTGAHPFMDPFTETRLWPHEYSPVYEAYNRIFDCRGHGWANLQSTHLNLPFAGDQEFGKLHAAIRLLLPILPALSASSPVLDLQVTGFSDTRLEVYRKNQAKVPALTGQVIPERVYTQKDYKKEIYAPIAAAMAPHDPEKELEEVYLNSRGAIARFDRSAIEIRVLDVQEGPLADIAILHAIILTLKALVNETWATLAEQQAWPEEELADILLRVIKDGQEAEIEEPAYLRAFGFAAEDCCTVRELWQHLLLQVLPGSEAPLGVAEALGVILSQGNLSHRILQSLGPDPSPVRLQQVYRHLADCLQTGKLYIPQAYA